MLWGRVIFRRVAVLFGGLLVASLAIDAQAGQPKSKTNSESTGIVVGSIVNGGIFGTGIVFQNTATKKETDYKGATTFSLSLPEGEYILSQVGATPGSTGPVGAPLRFKVKRGIINYVGSINYDCLGTTETGVAYGVRLCGFLALSKHCDIDSSRTISLCPTDRHEKEMAQFLKGHPEDRSLPVETDVMHP